MLGTQQNFNMTLLQMIFTYSQGHADCQLAAGTSFLHKQAQYQTVEDSLVVGHQANTLNIT